MFITDGLSDEMPSSSSVWMKQGLYPVKGRTFPPILNEESRIASGADIRSSRFGICASVVQVKNTFTTIHSK